MNDPRWEKNLPPVKHPEDPRDRYSASKNIAENFGTNPAIIIEKENQTHKCSKPFCDRVGKDNKCPDPDCKFMRVISEKGRYNG
ncbi:MAG: hypothetical protein P1P85_03195 [Patescibacteria group bacterium]|nr:hypothetical protein [Patescibacteria group bacterium]